MELSILHLTDLHFQESDATFLEELREKIITSLKQNTTNIDLCIFSGDLVHKPSFDLFEKAYLSFIDPILTSLKLNISNCFFTVGNHDINLEKRNRIMFSGIQDLIITKNDHKVLQELINHKTILSEMEDYKQFIDKYSDEQTLIINNQLYTAYQYKKNNIEIGIISLNSSLFMVGSNNDYGELYIPEDLLLEAAKDIQNCTIKIVNIHHALNWYKNKKEIEKILLDKFNLVFFGHEHEHDGKYILDLQNRDILSLHGTSIHHRKNELNGYSIYKYDSNTLELSIENFVYNRQQRIFNPIQENKLKDIDLTSKSSKAIRNQIICSEMYSKIKTAINQYLTINMTSEIHHKDIENIFVEQKIVESDEKSEKKKFKNDEEDQKHYTLLEIIKSHDNILLCGKTESGKTTNLNMLNLRFLKQYNDLIPIFFSSSELMLETTQRAFISKIGEYLDTYYGKHKFKIDSMLEEKRFILLIDDIHLLKCELVENILKLNNRIIATHTTEIGSDVEKLLEDINQDVPQDINHYNKFKKLELKALRKKECSLLAKKIAPIELSGKISVKVQKSLSTLSLPSNPFITTLLIWMHLEKIDIRENEPEIIDIFLDYLLEKTDLSKKFKGKIDFKDKKDLLSAIAYNYFQAKSFAIKEDVILKTIIQKLSFTGSEVNSSEILQYFYDRKILLKNNNNVIFSYRVFYYYFISLYMINTKEFRQKILEDKILISNMPDELRYYAAMSRKDTIFLNQIIDFIRANYFNNKIINNKIDFEQFPNIAEEALSMKDEFYSTKQSNVVISSFPEEISLTDQEQKISESIDDTMSEVRDNRVQTYNYETQENENLKDLKKYREEFFVLNMIASEFLKHLDSSVQFEEKNQYLNELLNNYCLCIAYWDKTISNKILVNKFLNSRLKDDIKNLKEKELEEFREFFKLKVITIITEIAQGTLATPKLTKSYKENIQKTSFENHYFFYSILLSEISDSNFLVYIKNFIKVNSNPILFDLLEMKLSYDYLSQDYSSSTKKELYEVLLRLNIINNYGKGILKNKRAMDRYLVSAKQNIDNQLKIRKLLI